MPSWVSRLEQLRQGLEFLKTCPVKKTFEYRRQSKKPKVWTKTSKTTFNNDQPCSGKEKDLWLETLWKKVNCFKRKNQSFKDQKIKKNWNNVTKLQNFQKTYKFPPNFSKFPPNFSKFPPNFAKFLQRSLKFKNNS